jgi:hypothetical protein
MHVKGRVMTSILRSIALFLALASAPALALAEDRSEPKDGPLTVAQADGPMVITPKPAPDGGYGPDAAAQPGYSPQGSAGYSGVPQSNAAPGTPYRPYTPPETQTSGTYSLDEIKDAGGRFFGKVSMGFARVVEYAFQRAGRPNGYILGEEAGGAFIAGLRYGEGTLYTKDAGSYKVYWQGPSLGYDFGADGSKTMVLVYNLQSPGEIFDTFAGVDGSAYFIGGVGITFLAGDHVTLAPISSGVGLRLGANVGYLKYTREPTWNPF